MRPSSAVARVMTNEVNMIFSPVSCVKGNGIDLLAALVEQAGLRGIFSAGLAKGRARGVVHVDATEGHDGLVRAPSGTMRAGRVGAFALLVVTTRLVVLRALRFGQLGEVFGRVPGAPRGGRLRGRRRRRLTD